MRSAFLLFVCLAVPLAAQVQFTQAKDRISVSIEGKPFTEFFFGADVNKPYLHPLRTASGTVVTRLYPMQDVPGESKDHPHHRGLWFTHGDVNGFDFWANEDSQKSPKKGKVVLKKIHSVKGGKDRGTIAATFNWVDGDGRTILTEDRTMVFYADPKNRPMDFDIKLTALEPVKFGDTKEGTFAIRLAQELEEKHTGKMVSADGKETEKNVWGTMSPWVDYAGERNGEKLGIAIFDHPSNPRHPTYWHSRAYGLFAANIFGHHDFLRDKAKDGSLSLKAGETLRFRYRVLIHPGDAASGSIRERYLEYAKPKS